MKKVSIFLTIFICFCLSINKVNASCSYTRTANLKKIASNVNITYTYTIVNNEALFDIRIANLTDDIYVYDIYNDKKYTTRGEIVLRSFKDGMKYRFLIRSNDDNCKDESLSTRYVTLPKYNIYYGDPVCKGIEDYSLCQKWGTFNVANHDDYVGQINKYKASLSKNKNLNEDEKELTIVEKIVNFFLKYYIIVLISVIIICLGLMYYLSEKDKFDF